MKKMIFCDISLCDNCGECVTACAREHFGRVSMFVQPVADFFVPANCRHCEYSPCVEVCPTGACTRNDAGVVSIATLKCVGCQLCNIACPFGAIWFDALDKVSRKCDQCRERLTYDLEPACVKACTPQHALVFGEYDELVKDAGDRKMDLKFSRAGGGSGMLVRIPAGIEKEGG